MFDPKTLFPFDAEKMAEMFKTADVSKMMEQMKVPGIDAEAMMAAQKKNVDALVAANKAASAGYQDLFKKQVAVFEETMAAAKTQLASMGENAMTADGAAKQAELLKAAYEKAVANMTDLAEAAKKANEDAYGIFEARVKESMADLQALAPKA